MKEFFILTLDNKNKVKIGVLQAPSEYDAFDLLYDDGVDLSEGYSLILTPKQIGDLSTRLEMMLGRKKNEPRKRKKTA